jgi:hypothetical protein
MLKHVACCVRETPDLLRATFRKNFCRRFLVIEHSIYGGLIATTFAVLGIWLGLKLTEKQKVIVKKFLSWPENRSFWTRGTPNHPP